MNNKYTTDENGRRNLMNCVNDATTSESFVADYLKTQGYQVSNVTQNRKTDLLCKKDNNPAFMVEIKHNYNNDNNLWIETVSVFDDYSREHDVKGWIYTTESKYIIFLAKDYTELYLADVVSLRKAFIEVKAMVEGIEDGDTIYKYKQDYQETTKDKQVYKSAAYKVSIVDLKLFGAKLKHVSFNNIIDDHVADTIKFQDERSRWLEKLNDGFLSDETVKALKKKFV